MVELERACRVRERAQSREGIKGSWRWSSMLISSITGNLYPYDHAPLLLLHAPPNHHKQ